MINEQDFYRELGKVPELPHDFYAIVRRKIRRRIVFSRTALALAATFILAIGTTGILVTHQRNDLSLSSEVAEELQTVDNYLTGEDLDQEYASYALYEGER
jgi:hypothetical protein